MIRCLGCMEELQEEQEICPHCGYAVGTKAVEVYHLEPGTILANKYLVGRAIGYGGFGVTYVGYDMVLERKVAIKEYLPGEFATRVPGQEQLTIYEGEKREQFDSGIEKFLDEARRSLTMQTELFTSMTVFSRMLRRISSWSISMVLL